ncbi:DUF6519 domain-containing protein [Bradyrhizobium sp. USDA 3458]|uniref:DUF6519 domain-containing protein n=1 Tax=Bradyrhizobium sp. USDA 3458 TaxID=2591461 RepID=UPI0011438A42|nr:DUF6519 domain-containing protein [Bradyrhizobium sp. USDA 3458]
MGGDYGRLSFDALRDFVSVLIQQGHPILDSDWNELVAILERRFRAETVDVVGRAVVPRETPTGFEIRLAAGPVLAIGRGRMYVDGLLAENHGRIGLGAAPVFDRARVAAGKPVGVLDEAISQEANDFIEYTGQPYLPVPPGLPASDGPHIAYLDVWRREVTPLKEPGLLEPALGGIDTATRWQTVWQVRLLADAGGGTTCTTALPAWDALVAPSPARLTTATTLPENPEDPCLIPPGGGYRGLENQLYRVEIHGAGPLGGARFKWSRDNASVGATIEAFDGGSRVIVRRVGRDSVLRLKTGDWVEITDDHREFSGLPGDMRRATVNEDTNELTFDTPLSADLVPSGLGTDTAAAKHSRVIKWDQSGQVRLADGTAHVDLDDPASDGLIPVPIDGSAVVLEAGITVAFTTEAVGGVFREFDHWLFAARTETRTIDVLAAAPPSGIHHHYARLAVLNFPDRVTNCRTFWPPEFGECGCTACVSAEEHNSGVRTIQTAIGDLPAEGGTVCLGPGSYLLGDTAIEVNDLTSVRLRGHGLETTIAYAGTGAAIRIAGSEDIRITDISITVVDAQDGREPSAGMLIGNSEQICVEHCAINLPSRARDDSTGIALKGFILGLNVRDNTILAPITIGSLTARQQDGTDYCALMDVRIQANKMFGERCGVSLNESVIHLGTTEIASNLILARGAGVILTGAEAPADSSEAAEREDRTSWSSAAVLVHGNSIGFARSGDGVISGVQNLRLLDNEIVAFGNERSERSSGNCVRLVEGLLSVPWRDGQLIGNRLGNVDGVGIAIEAHQAVLLIKRNIIRNCGVAGIAAAADASIGFLSLDNNVIERIGTRDQQVAVAGVRLATISEACIIGNIVRNIGLAESTSKNAYCAGFDLRGVISLDLAHNTISDIGREQKKGFAIGILLDGVALNGELSSNRIVGSLARDAFDESSWCGILVDTRMDRRDQEEGNLSGLSLAAFPAYFERNNATFALSTVGATRFAQYQNVQLRVAGNLIQDCHETSALPLVRVETELRRSEQVYFFAENECTLRAVGTVVDAIVQLTAPRLIVGSNAVRRVHQPDVEPKDSIHMTCLVSGELLQVIFIGNLINGIARINGHPSGNISLPLNILSP